jgi:polyvinyl alcohol dehydrogenase (cytochrome)
MAGFGAPDVPRLKLKWAFGFPGANAAPAQPAVAGGRVFVGSATGTVYALDAATGCTWWTYQAAEAAARTAVSVGPRPGGWAVYFGDQAATVHALDAATGAVLWKTKVDDFWAARVTGSPLLSAGRLYVPVSSDEETQGLNAAYECCRFRGSVSALDAATGRLIWKTYTIADPPRPVGRNRSGTQLWGPAGAGVWSSPTLDVKRRVLYVGTGNAYNAPDPGVTDAILALDLETGRLVWSRQFTENDWYTFGCRITENCPEPVGPDFDFASSPILRELPGGRRVLIAAQKSGMVYGLDPDRDGAVLWSTRVGRGGPRGGVQWGPATDDRHVYVAVSDVVSAAPHEAGGIHALRLADGGTFWYTPAPPLACRPGARGCNAAQSAAVTATEGVVFSGSVEGKLRAYSTASGAILWEFDTARAFPTVNGVSARGGSIDGPGPVAAGGMLFVNSGYDFFLGDPGNVLLAFSVDGR